MEELISRLVKKGIRIGASGDSLRIQVGNVSLTDADKQELKNYKSEIVTLLKNAKVAILSYPQERLWFLAQLGYSLQYHIPSVVKIKGNLNVLALKQTLDLIVDRHESFRTSFRHLGSGVVQFIQDHEEFLIEEIDLTHYQDSDQAKEYDRLTSEFINRPFDLEKAPLLRTQLIRLSDQEHILSICMHHIISDGWSSTILMKELSTGYESFSEGQKPDFPPLKMQYSGYSVWQKETLTDEKLVSELDYWKSELMGYEDLDMPTDYPRPYKLTGKGAYEFVYLTDEESKILKSFSRERKTTVFTLLVAATYTLLQRYSRQDDICFGMPVANRNHKDIEDIVGFFVNTLVLRILPEEGKPFTVNNLLDKVNRVIVDGQDNQDIPIEKVMEFLQPKRDLSRSPIFQVLINYSTIDDGDVSFGECELEGMPSSSEISKFDLTFGFSDSPSGELGIGIEYCTDLFLPGTIQSMIKHFVNILMEFPQKIHNTLDEVKFTKSEDQTQLLKNWNSTEKQIPALCIHEIFEKKVLENPAAIAVKYADQQLTYNQLNDKSNVLAKYLQKSGIKTGDVVGLSMNRSLNMIVSVMGILKSGAAYLPLDPAYPEDRITHMLSDASVNLILTDSHVEQKLSALVSDKVKIVAMDTKWEEMSSEVSDYQLLLKYSAQDLAYVIYTSGSTGTPKGVLVNHRNVVNHNMAAIDIYDLSPTDKVMQFSTINFDIFVEEVFPTLLVGATLIMLDAKQYLNIDYIKSTIKTQEVTLVNWPTAFWHSMAEESFADTKLRMVIIGGEKAEIAYANSWQRFNPKVRVMNTYGPTETTVISLFHEIKGEQNRNIPIGKPIANTQVYVINSKLNPVAVGIPGELCIAGDGVSMGYLNRADLTAERFIESNFNSGSKMYRTGDLVRWNSEGELEFLGRIDQQVKVRGFRVEPGEIENVMVGHTDIESAVVIAKEFNIGKQLVAYYTGTQALQHADLKKYMLKSVPDYMVPISFNYLDSIPITSGGKVNRRLLKEMKISVAGNENFVAPETDSQIKLADLWKEVLQIEKIGIYDNFFQLGGHSIMATQLLSKINRVFNCEIPLTELYESSSLEDLATLLEELKGDMSSQDNEEMEIETFEF